MPVRSKKVEAATKAKKQRETLESPKNQIGRKAEELVRYLDTPLLQICLKSDKILIDTESVICLLL